MVCKLQKCIIWIWWKFHQTPTLQCVKLLITESINMRKRKKKKRLKKKQHTVSVKELRFRPNTDDHDLEFKTRHAREFLESGDKVKASVQFRGRDMLYTEKGELLLLRLAKSLEDVAKIESKPNMKVAE